MIMDWGGSTPTQSELRPNCYMYAHGEDPSWWYWEEKINIRQKQILCLFQSYKKFSKMSSVEVMTWTQENSVFLLTSYVVTNFALFVKTVPHIGY